jgi:hypothetical protein
MSFVICTYSPNITKVMKIEENVMGGAYGMCRKLRNAHRVLMGKPDGKRPAGYHTR